MMSRQYVKSHLYFCNTSDLKHFFLPVLQVQPLVLKVIWIISGFDIDSYKGCIWNSAESSADGMWARRESSSLVGNCISSADPRRIKALKTLLFLQRQKQSLGEADKKTFSHGHLIRPRVRNQLYQLYSMWTAAHIQ